MAVAVVFHAREAFGVAFAALAREAHAFELRAVGDVDVPVRAGRQRLAHELRSEVARDRRGDVPMLDWVDLRPRRCERHGEDAGDPVLVRQHPAEETRVAAAGRVEHRQLALGVDREICAAVDAAHDEIGTAAAEFVHAEQHAIGGRSGAGEATHAVRGEGLGAHGVLRGDRVACAAAIAVGCDDRYVAERAHRFRQRGDAVGLDAVVVHEENSRP